MYYDEENNDEDNEEVDEETKELMTDYDLDQDEAKKVHEIMEENGLDPEDAIEVAKDL